MTSNHITGPSLGAPPDDPRLDVCDLYVFASPNDPARTVLILTANPGAGPMRPGAVYRVAIDNDGDLRNDIAFNFVFSEPVEGPDGARQKADVYLALGATARVDAAAGSRIFGDVEVSFGKTPHVWRSGGFLFFVGARSDAAFVDRDGIANLLGGDGAQNPWTGRDAHAGADVIAMAIELPTDYLGARPDVRIWARVSLLEDRTWRHVDRTGHPLVADLLTGLDGAAPGAFAAGEPNRDRDRWIGALIEVMGELGGYRREDAVEAINAEGTLPDMLTYRPGKPTAYPNGRTLTDDVADYRLGFLTDGGCPPSGLAPHDDLLPAFPYLGAPHSRRP
ncbi:DUF4331 domain-containing protein [Mycobacterium sp. Y57]|nr:DUF4331 domain-containing protein [Mycolicibacterium xanthum]